MKWQDRIELLDNRIVVIVKGIRGRKGHEQELDCFQEREDGVQLCRNLYLSMYGGYRIDYLETIDAWDLCGVSISPDSMFTGEKPTDKELELIYSKYPNFKYVIQKWSGTRRRVIKILQKWLEHPMIELPLSLGYENVCYTKQFYTMSKDMQKKVFDVMRKYPKANYTLTDCKEIATLGYDGWHLRRTIMQQIGTRVSKGTIEYLSHLKDKVGGEYYYLYRNYKHYISLVKKAGHNVDDIFWKYPTNYKKNYDKVQAECLLIDEAERARQEQERLIREQEQEQRRLDNYAKCECIANRFLDYFSKVDGYDFFMPLTVNQWVTQAAELNQCLIRCDYPSKMAKGDVLMVFIHKDGVPVATAEITDLVAKKIGQFYGNEEDRNNCIPSDDVRSALYKWVDTLPVVA